MTPLLNHIPFLSLLFYVTLVFPLAFEFERFRQLLVFREATFFEKYSFVWVVDFCSLLFNSYVKFRTFLYIFKVIVLYFFKRMLLVIDLFFNVVSSQGRVMLPFPWELFIIINVLIMPEFFNT